MYLKKYDLDRVSDETAERLLELSTDKPPEMVGIYNRRTDEGIDILSLVPSFKLVIVNSGDMYLSYNGRFAVVLHPQKVQHLLLETQWIKETEKVPEHGQKIVLKAKTCDDGFVIYNCELFEEQQKEGDKGYPMIYYMAENNSDGIAYDLFDTEIIGWLPADNVVL